MSGRKNRNRNPSLQGVSTLGKIPEDRSANYRQFPMLDFDQRPLCDRIPTTLNWNSSELLTALACYVDILKEKARGGDGSESMGVHFESGRVERWLNVIMGQTTELNVNINVTPADVKAIVELICDSCSRRHAKDMPITLAMTQVHVSFSGKMDAEYKKSLCQMVWEMNGLCSEDLTPQTTHLVTTQALAERTMLARLRGLPVMHPSWIEKVYKESQHDPYFHAKELQEQHAFSLFHKLHFALSSSVGEFSKYVRTALLEHEAKEVEAYQLEEGDLLICRHTNEPEYATARQIGAHVSTPAWPVFCHFDNQLHNIMMYYVKPPDPDYLYALDESQSDLIKWVDPDSVEPENPFGPIGSKPPNPNAH